MNNINPNPDEFNALVPKTTFQVTEEEALKGRLPTERMRKKKLGL